MRLQYFKLADARGKFLCHNVVDARGRKVLHKGTRLGPEEIATLRELGYTEVWAAELEPDDVHEDEVARRVTEALAGEGTALSALATGRANLKACTTGVLHIDVEALQRLNRIPGLAIATKPRHTLVRIGEIVATIKVVPYAMPRARVEEAVAVARDAGAVIAVRSLPARRVGILLTGAPVSEAQVRRVYDTAVRERLEEWGSTVIETLFVPEDPHAIAQGLQQLLDAGAEMVVIAGETSVVDEDDITPRGVRQAGGHIEAYGVPVDPGNLLMLAYLDGRPVVGAPGCVRSRSTNVVDLVVPRLLAGERLTRDDLVALGHGGLVG